MRFTIKSLYVNTVESIEFHSLIYSETIIILFPKIASAQVAENNIMK